MAVDKLKDTELKKENKMLWLVLYSFCQWQEKNSSKAESAQF